MSIEHPDGGRVLREPCRIDLDGFELLSLLERIHSTVWTPEAALHALAAGALLLSRAAA